MTRRAGAGASGRGREGPRTPCGDRAEDRAGGRKDPPPLVAAGRRDTAACDRAADCRTLPLWTGLEKTVNDYLDRFTLADLMKR